MKLLFCSQRTLLKKRRLPLLSGLRGCTTRGPTTEDNHDHRSKARRAEPRLSYWHSPGSEPLRMTTLGQLMDRAADRWAHQDAVVSSYEGTKLTYRQLKDQAEQLGAGLLKLGLRQGDRLALLGVNSLHWFLVMAAAAKAGIITVMLNPSYTVQELASALKYVGARALVSDYKFRAHSCPQMLEQLMPGMSSAPPGQPLSSAGLPALEFAIVATQAKLPGCYRLDDIKGLATGRKGIKEVEERIQPEDPFCIQFSSGTTGLPKGALLSHFAMINNAHFTGKRSTMDQRKFITCLQLPFFHSFGAVVGIFVSIDFGNTTVIPGPVFNKNFTIDSLLKHKCSFIPGTPTMFIDLHNELQPLVQRSEEHRRACENVRAVMCGGAFVPPEVTKNIKEMFPFAKIFIGLGMTEMCGTASLSFPDDSPEIISETIGYPTENVEVKIVDENGRIVPVGAPGEAWFRSPYSLLRYWADEEKSRQTKTDDGWLKSGDIMYMREDSYLSIIGRKKDVIIRGGANVFPAEIEKVLLQHPQIVNAEVYGVASRRLGEEVAVSIKLSSTSTLNASDVQEYCKGKISYFKIPKYVRFVDEYPLTPAGKVKKYSLKETHEKELLGKDMP